MPTIARQYDNEGKIVRLEVRTTVRSEDGCCGGAAPAGAGACCALDAELKHAGGSGCGCGATAAAPRSGECC